MSEAKDEQAVGIRSYVSSTPGFTAILKQRFSDFHVNEVSESDGAVAVLTSTGVPEAIREDVLVAQMAPDVPDSTDKTLDEVLAEVRALSDDAAAASLRALVEGEGERGEASLHGAWVGDKEKRTAMHQMLKSGGPLGALDSQTRQGDGGESYIAVFKGQGRGDARGGGRAGGPRRWQWPGGKERKYLRFVMYKENIESNAAVGILCRMLGPRVKPSTFSLAGTKDRRGCTTQFGTAYMVSAERLASMNRKLRGIRVQPLAYVDKELAMGALRGNR